jgi:hypothetical protein
MRNSTFHIPAPSTAAMTATTAPVGGANSKGALAPRHAC